MFLNTNLLFNKFLINIILLNYVYLFCKKRVYFFFTKISLNGTAVLYAFHIFSKSHLFYFRFILHTLFQSLQKFKIVFIRFCQKIYNFFVLILCNYIYLFLVPQYFSILITNKISLVKYFPKQKIMQVLISFNNYFNISKKFLAKTDIRNAIDLCYLQVCFFPFITNFFIIKIKDFKLLFFTVFWYYNFDNFVHFFLSKVYLDSFLAVTVSSKIKTNYSLYKKEKKMSFLNRFLTNFQFSKLNCFHLKNILFTTCSSLCIYEETKESPLPIFFSKRDLNLFGILAKFRDVTKTKTYESF